MLERHQEKRQDWEGPGPGPRRKKRRLRKVRDWVTRMFFTWPYFLFSYTLLAALCATIYWGLIHRRSLEQKFERQSAYYKSEVRLATVTKMVRRQCEATGRPPSDLQEFLKDEFPVVDGIQPHQDFWGGDFFIVVAPHMVMIYSPGPDGERYTVDDLMMQFDRKG
ncbi:MAG: hypothetical protein AB7S38_29380 [Vulcanimicrobiota bacterium]